MALPDNGQTQWPPASHEQAYRDMEMMDAWYTGDIEALETLYSTTRLVRQAGIWGQAKRFFMGTPNPGQQSQRPVKLHVPVPAEIARISSQVLYGEMPKVEVADLDNDGDTPTIPEASRRKVNARLVDLLDASAHAAFLESGELGAALGGCFLRVTWDTVTVPDAPFITSVAPDAAVPDFRFGRLSGVTFWSELSGLPDTPGVYRLLERHEPGTIEYGLYVTMNKDQLGTRVPLEEHPATAGLAPLVDSESTVRTGTDLLTAVYIPNVRPVRVRRKDPVASQLGRSDYEGLDGLFDALDEVYTSWMRDIRLGKARILVDRQLIDTNGPGQGAYFDSDRDVFTPLNGAPGAIGSQGPGATSANGGLISSVQFAIRWQEHQQTATALLEQIFTAAGYAPATFGLESTHTRTLTATEVQAREKLTLLTRGAKLLYAKPQIQRLVAALLDVDQHVFHGPGRFGAMPEVQFPDAAAPSADALAQTLQLLRTANAASTETLVQMLNPDWEPEQVEQEVARINAEGALPPLPDPTGMTGADLAANGPDAADGYPGDRYSAANGSTGPGVGDTGSGRGAGRGRGPQ